MVGLEGGRRRERKGMKEGWREGKGARGRKVEEEERLERERRERRRRKERGREQDWSTRDTRPYLPPVSGCGDLVWPAGGKVVLAKPGNLSQVSYWNQLSPREIV